MCMHLSIYPSIYIFIHLSAHIYLSTNMLSSLLLSQVVNGLEGEERAFWTLVALCQQRLFPTPPGGAVGYRVEQRVLAGLAVKKLPAISAHLAACLECPLSNLTNGWYASLFTGVLPSEVRGLRKMWGCGLRKRGGE
jgi:hypothetical protein